MSVESGAIFVVVGMFVAFRVLQMRGRVSPDDAKRHVVDGALLLDVRTPVEFAAARLDGAVNIPVHELVARLDELGDRQRSVVVYCRSGVRSARAKRLLAARGFASVHDLGPMSRWH